MSKNYILIINIFTNFLTKGKDMTDVEIKNIIEKQRNFFKTGATLNTSYRIEALKKLKKTIETYSGQIEEALFKDLGKSRPESYMCEIGISLSEISYMIKNISSFSKEKKVPTPIALFPAKSFTKPSPYGVTLIMNPWNYPFQLGMVPLIDAVAAGNTVVLKPSAYSEHTSRLLKTIISECFDEQYVAVITGGRAENATLLNERFDYILFTGSHTVGKEILKKAAEYLTPVTLELGGKSPCIVEKSADIKLAAKRIVFGKYLNAGQTCVAPDYIYCDSLIKDELIAEIKNQIVIQYSNNPLDNKTYGKIINEKHFNRLIDLIDKEKVVFGGKSDSNTLKIEPTIMDNVTFEDNIMQEEIFGPLLPILTYDSLDYAIEKINSMPHPLAFYIFTVSKKVANKVISKCQFGGGCINDTIVHLATSEMGFGGVGSSGMGAYHGKTGFDTFSHYKSIVSKKKWPEPALRYQPYSSFWDKIIRKILK